MTHKNGIPPSIIRQLLGVVDRSGAGPQHDHLDGEHGAIEKDYEGYEDDGAAEFLEHFPGKLSRALFFGKEGTLDNAVNLAGLEQMWNNK